MAKKNKNTKKANENGKYSDADSLSNDSLEFEGEVVEKLPNSQYRVNINGNIVLAHASGKMRVNSITITVGDKVRVEISPYDLNRGIIKYRSK